MRKSKKITSILLACCAFLLVAITGLGVTMAKYVKSETKTTTAKVAAFGITMAWAGDFAESYTTDNTSVKDSIANSVVSTNKVVAPGTTGTITLTLDGTSEVAFTLAISITETYSEDNWKESATGDPYYPISYTVTSTAKVGETDITVESDNKTINPINVAPGMALSGVITITWAWPFETTGKDLADTYMSTVADATYTISASSTATQIN